MTVITCVHWDFDSNIKQYQFVGEALRWTSTEANSFYAPGFFLKPLENIKKRRFLCFQVVQREISNMKWFNTNILAMP